MKKKLLAFVLSAMMLTESVLPVVAADDVDVVVSENAAEEVTEDAVAEEEAATEETAAEEVTEDVVEEEPVFEEALTEIDDTVKPYAYEEIVISEKDGEKIAEGYSYYLMRFNEDGTSEILSADDIDDIEEDFVSESATPHIYSNNAKSHRIEADPFEIDGKTFPLNAIVTYNYNISYREKAVKAVDHLNANVSTSSGLYSIANSLSTAGNVSQDIFKWKYTMKKNKAANSESYFTVKASVNTKVAKKQFGITGKSLSKLKKAVRSFNKAAKKDHIMFNIDQVDFDKMAMAGYAVVVEKCHITYCFGIVTSRKFTGFELKCKIRPDQPEPDTAFDKNGAPIKKIYNKLTKLKNKKEISLDKVDNRHYKLTILNKNFKSTKVYNLEVQGRYSNV